MPGRKNETHAIQGASACIQSDIHDAMCSAVSAYIGCQQVFLNILTYAQTDRQTRTLTDQQTDRHADRLTYRNAHTHTHTHTHQCMYIMFTDTDIGTVCTLG